MSAIPPIPDDQEEEVVLSAYAKSLIDKPLSNQEGIENPVTYGQRFDGEELEVLSTYFVKTDQNERFIKDVEEGRVGEKVQKDFKNTLDKFAFYNRPPIEEEPNPFQLPEFIQEKIPFIPKQRQLQRELNSYGFSGRDQYKDPYAGQAALEFGELLINPKATFQKQFLGKGDSALRKSPRFIRNWYDRVLSPDELERIFIKAGGYAPEDVDAQYIDPNQHKLGVGIRTPDTNGYEIFDQPHFSFSDILETIGTDTPAYLGEAGARILALRAGIGKKTFNTGTTKSIFGRMKEVAETGITFGVGGATGEFARLATGSILEFNDYDLVEIADRSAMTGIIATGSVIAGDVGIRILTKLKDLPRGLVPDASFKSLKESFEKAFNTGRRKNKQPPVVLVQSPETGEWVWEEVAQETLDNAKLIDAERLSEEITTFDIQNAVSKLLPDINYTIEGPDKILNVGAALPKEQLINDLEHVFLKNSADAEIRKVYDAMIKGQEGVLNRFLYALNDATGSTIDKNVSAADLSEELTQFGTTQIDVIRQGQEESLTNILNTLGGLEDDTGEIGRGLAAQVNDPEAGAGFMPRDQLEIKKLKKDFQKPAFDNWSNALANSQYVDLTTNARFLKFPVKEWKNIANDYEMFQNVNNADAKNSLYTILGQDGANKLRRLQGLGEVGKGGFENPNFTMASLNEMRVVLNEFASEPTTNTQAFRAARKLERGLENQMQYLINSKASELSGIPLNLNNNSKNAEALAQWKIDNNFGIDLEKTWVELKEDIYRSSVINDTQGLQSNPENFVNNLVKNTPKFSKTYKNAEDLVYIFEKTGNPGLNQLRRSTSAYIQQNVLGGEFETPFLKAKEFGKWATEHEGLLNAIYPKEIFGKVTSPKQFQKVIDMLQESDNRIVEIEQMFGNKSFTNVVTDYLDQNGSFKRSGDYKNAQKSFLNLVKGDPLLQNKLSGISKSWLLNTVMERDAENVPVLNTEKLNSLFNEGFGSAQTGETFEKFFAPLIGGAEGKQYVYNLEILNNIAQRQRGMEASAAALENKELTTPQTGIMERFFIPPLTQTGRRITNFRNITGDRSARMMAEMLLDPKLFNKVMRKRKRDLSIHEFLRFVGTNEMISSYEAANKLSAYEDPENRKRYTGPAYEKRMEDLSKKVDTFNYIINKIIPGGST